MPSVMTVTCSPALRSTHSPKIRAATLTSGWTSESATVVGDGKGVNLGGFQELLHDNVFVDSVSLNSLARSEEAHILNPRCFAPLGGVPKGDGAAEREGPPQRLLARADHRLENGSPRVVHGRLLALGGGSLFDLKVGIPLGPGLDSLPDHLHDAVHRQRWAETDVQCERAAVRDDVGLGSAEDFPDVDGVPTEQGMLSQPQPVQVVEEEHGLADGVDASARRGVASHAGDLDVNPHPATRGVYDPSIIGLTPDQSISPEPPGADEIGDPTEPFGVRRVGLVAGPTHPFQRPLQP